MIPNAFIDTVSRKTDVVELIGSYVELTERGNDFVGLCPFDAGDKPTFSVSLGKQIYKCFKCKAGGRAVDFIMLHQKITFPKAIALLAKGLDLEIPEEV